MSSSLLSAEIPKSLLEGLSSENFKDRETSQAQLLSWAENGEKEKISSIFLLSKDLTDPEVSIRCLNVLKLLSDQDYLSDGQGYLGIQMLEEFADLPGDEMPRACIRVTLVVPDSPAARSGVRAGDLITALDGKKWHGVDAMEVFMRTIAETKPLTPVILTISRKERESMDVEVKLGKRPIQNLLGFNQDIQLLDQRARQLHFEKWLRRFQVQD